MPARNLPLVNEEYYHIFNRGVAKMPIFLRDKDYQRFIDAFIYYLDANPEVGFSKSSLEQKNVKSSGQIVDMICYCLMPNHFHFLLRQNIDNGVVDFIRKVTNSYAKYFNTKYKRKGPLFEGKFKAIRVESNEQLLHLSRYIHLNPLVGYVTKDLRLHKWSSYSEYVQTSNSDICSLDVVLNQFQSTEDYERFVLDHEDYGKKLEQIKHQLLEEAEKQWT